MESVVVSIAVLAIVGYGLYKIFVKKETPAEAAVEIKDEVVAEAKKIEEVVAPVVEATVVKVEDVAVAKYKEELAAFVEAETKVAKEIVAEVEKVVEEVKAVEAKVEEVVVAEVKKTKARVMKAADVNEDGKVDIADVVEVVKKGRRSKKPV